MTGESGGILRFVKTCAFFFPNNYPTNYVYQQHAYPQSPLSDQLLSFVCSFGVKPSEKCPELTQDSPRTVWHHSNWRGIKCDCQVGVGRGGSVSVWGFMHVEINMWKLWNIYCFVCLHVNYRCTSSPGSLGDSDNIFDFCYIYICAVWKQLSLDIYCFHRINIRTFLSVYSLFYQFLNFLVREGEEKTRKRVPERQPDKRLPHPRTEATNDSLQVVTRNNNTGLFRGALIGTSTLLILYRAWSAWNTKKPWTINLHNCCHNWKISCNYWTWAVMPWRGRSLWRVVCSIPWTSRISSSLIRLWLSWSTPGLNV